MRTFLTVLAAVAAAASVSAQVAFDKASCTRTNFPTDAYTFSPSTDGAWSCVNFDVAQNSAAAMKIQVPLSMEGAQMQVIMWNAAQQGGASGSSRVWTQTTGTSSQWPSLYHLNPQGAGGDLANFDPAVPDAASNSTVAVGMRVVKGSTGNAQADGVYAHVTNGNIALNLDTNYLQITHPDDDVAGRTGQIDYEGVFMWRFVDPRVNSVVNTAPFQTSGSWLSAAQTESTFGALSAGSTVNVNNLLLPGASVQFIPDSDTIINNVLPLRKFGYKVAISGTGVGNLTQVGSTRLIDTVAVPYGYADNTPLASFPEGGGSSTVSLGQGQSAWYNFTDASIMDDRVRNVSWADSTTTLQGYWNKPLDTVAARLDEAAFGRVSVTVPDFTSGTTVARYDWTNQASPFINVAVTLTDFETFPMLSSLSNLRLRNHGIDEDEGHSLASPVNQVPFAIYLVRTDPSAYNARVAFSNVVNLNNEDGVAPAAADASTSVSPGCDPLWEVQPINGYQMSSSSNANRAQSGWSSTWYHPNSGSAGSSSAWPMQWTNIKSARGIQVSSTRVAALKNSNFDDYHHVMTTPPTRRAVWLAVRISAARPTLASQSTLQCGSNWVQIGSASWRTTSVSGQCSSTADCTVNSADNPNEDQASESANNAANRFSTCAIVRSISNGEVVPSTKCVECLSDAQCDGGQYCHLDEGFCSGPNGYRYVCDQPSHDRVGLCRAKSTDVLGARCTPNFLSDGTVASRIEAATAIGSQTDNAPQSGSFSWRGQGALYSIPGPTDYLITKGDAKNSDFAPGARGACGEFRFWNGTTLPAGLGNTLTRSLTGANFDGIYSHTGRVRTTLWSGLCVNMGGNLGHRCVECLPGSGANGAAAGSSSFGKICLNGRAHSARDVDGTVRSYTTDTGASTELGTTMMVVLLILLFWTHMYAEAKRWRIANGKKAMTCCECICCCGVCSNEGGEAPAADDSGKSAAQTAPAPAPEAAPEADAEV